MKLVDANKVLKEILDTYEYEFPTASGAFDEFITQVIPNIFESHVSVDVAPVKHGHWVDMGDFEECSCCHGTQLKHIQTYYGETSIAWIKTNYCHNCGAKMDDT